MLPSCYFVHSNNISDRFSNRAISNSSITKSITISMDSTYSNIGPIETLNSTLCFRPPGDPKA